MRTSIPSVSVLVTGFGPFGSELINPSGLIAAELGGIVLPVDASAAWAIAKSEMKHRRATAILALGVGGGREWVCVERRAANAAEYAIPDDAGRVFHGPLESRGVAFLETRLREPAEVARAIRQAGPKARVSRDAGRYVCNHFYFLLLHHLRGQALFLHLPRLPEIELARGGNGPTLPFEDGLRAVHAALRFLERGKGMEARE